MKKIFIIIIIISQFSGGFFAQSTRNQPAVRIVPDKLDFCMGAQINDGIRYPIISFQCVAGNIDDEASDLILNRKDIGDTTFIDILGYDYINRTEELKRNNLPIAMMIRQSRKTIPLCNEYLKDKLPKYLIINLNGIKNQFEVISEGLKISLIPKRVINIEPFYKYPYFDPLEILLVPTDVFTAYLSGRTQDNTDYTSYLIEFCKSRDLFPVHIKYPQVPLYMEIQAKYPHKSLHWRKRHLLVYSNDMISIKKGRSLTLGYLDKYPAVRVRLKMYSHFNGF
jgi:hypothetical protein